ncbi:ion transporter [Thiorhodovibrio frisius]|uniref:Ion transport protein n=1 Tax=Thiorhodovibrio frisius TaxID=631362 RepID=H8YX61_9GAMM|nr:ion transporter [Thiorhodovibrio frisius]EIC23037.1 Ion transport protein [Thiorhodovibrio frisius]WPL22699.1 Ion transport protein [Thiorhodovibrio frisius]
MLLKRSVKDYDLIFQRTATNVVTHDAYNISFLIIIYLYICLLGIPFHFPDFALLSETLHYSNILITALFAGDFFLRLVSSKERANFFKHWPNWLDATIIILSVIPATSSNYLIVLRALRFTLLVALIQKVRNHFFIVARSPLFNLVTNVIIVIFALAAGLEASLKLTPQMDYYFRAINYFIIVYFIAEISIRILSEKTFQKFLSDGWNFFDFIIVVLTVLPFEQAIGIATARIIRLFRVVRLFSGISSLRNILTALGDSIKPILSIILLLIIIFYVYAVIGVHLYGSFPGTEKLWHDVPTAFLTLFRVLTFEDWTDVMYATQQIHPLHWMFFVSFIVLTVFVFLNLFTSVILENMAKSKENFLKQEVRDELRDLDGGGNLFNLKEPILLINFDEKLRRIIEIFDLREKAKFKRDALVLTRKKTSDIDSDFENILRSTRKLSLQFKTADISEPFLRHRYFVYNANKILIFVDLEFSQDGGDSKMGDTYNLQIFSALFSDKTFVLKLIEAYLLEKRKICLLEVSNENSISIFREVMALSLSKMIESFDEVSDPVFQSPFTQRLFIKVRDDFRAKKLSQARKKALSREPFFSIVHTSQYVGPIISEAIKNPQIFWIYRELFFSQDHQITYFPLRTFSNDDALVGLDFFDVIDSICWGSVIGVSSKDHYDGHLRPEIFPKPGISIEQADVPLIDLIVISDRAKLESAISQPQFRKVRHEELVDFYMQSHRSFDKVLQIGRELIDCGSFLDCDITVADNLDALLVEEITQYDRIILSLPDKDSYLVTMKLLSLIHTNLDLSSAEKRRINDNILVVFKERQYATALERSPFRFRNTIIINNIMSQLMVHIADEPEVRKLYNDFLVNRCLRFAFFHPKNGEVITEEIFFRTKRYLAENYNALPVALVAPDDSIRFGYECRKESGTFKALVGIVRQ